MINNDIFSGLIQKKLLLLKVSLQRKITFFTWTARRRKRKKLSPFHIYPTLPCALERSSRPLIKPSFFIFTTDLGGSFLKVKIWLPSPLSRSGVYLLCCKHCPTVYVVGETGCSFEIRVKDQSSAFVNRNLARSACARNPTEHDHVAGKDYSSRSIVALFREWPLNRRERD